MGFPSKAFGGVSSRQRVATSTIVLNVANTTGWKVVYTITGSVLIHAIWAEVSTVISSNHTKGHLRINDQTAQVDLTESGTGITLSALLVGTMIYKESLLAVALQLKNNAAGTVEEPASAGQPAFSPFILTKKTAAVTTLDYGYTTTNNPSTGGLKFKCIWEPLSDDGNVA